MLSEFFCSTACSPTSQIMGNLRHVRAEHVEHRFWSHEYTPVTCATKKALYTFDTPNRSFGYKAVVESAAKSWDFNIQSWLVNCWEGNRGSSTSIRSNSKNEEHCGHRERAG